MNQTEVMILHSPDLYIKGKICLNFYIKDSVKEEFKQTLQKILNYPPKITQWCAVSGGPDPLKSALFFPPRKWVIMKLFHILTCPMICIDSMTCGRGFLPILLGCGPALIGILESATPRMDSIERSAYRSI